MLTGPQRIDRAISSAKAEGRAALLVCLPRIHDLGWTIAAAQACAAAGADLLEFQVRLPVHPEPTVTAVAAVTPEVDAPCLLWSDEYLVRAFVLGSHQPWRLATACLDAGIAGVAAPLAMGEGARFADAVGPDLAAIAFAYPDMRPAHFAAACRSSTGFTYAIGVDTSPADDPAVFEGVAGFIERVRAASGTPVFVGSGVATPAQAALVGTFADGVAVAGAVFDTLERAAAEGRDTVAALATLVTELRAGLERQGRAY